VREALDGMEVSLAGLAVELHVATSGLRHASGRPSLPQRDLDVRATSR